MGRLTGTSGKGRLSSSSSKFDLNTIEGLNNYANTKGLGKQSGEIVNETPKLSFLQRLGKGLGAFNTAEAVLTTKEKGLGSGLLNYGKGIATGIGSAITGTDYEPQRRTYRDVVEQLGVENSIAKFGLGLIGDILLDPTTYFGGAIAKGVTKGGKLLAETGLSGVGKLAPESEVALRTAGGALKDAFGHAFVSGYKSTPGALEDTLTFLSKAEKAKMGLAASNLNRLGTGLLTKDQQTELALKLVAGKRAEFVERAGGIAETVGKSTDPIVQASIDAQKARTLKFGEQLGLENPYETYFPFIKKDRVENFIKETERQNIRVGSENYLKKFKNLLTNDAIELNPAKAFFTSEAQQVTNRMTKDFLGGFVEKYGKPLSEFTSVEDAVKSGFKVVKEHGLYGKEIGYINKFDSNVLSGLISPEFQTINMLAKATGFDAVTNLFKRSVTGLFLPFHVRNYASGLIQNFEVLGVKSLNPGTIVAGQKMAYMLAKGQLPKEGILEVAGKSTKMSKVYKAFSDRFSGDTLYQNDFLQAVEKGGNLSSAEKAFSKSALKKTLGFQKGNIVPLLGNDATPFKLARGIGQFIEHQQKATAYLTALQQGKTIQQSLLLAERAGFDYKNLTAFESQIMRRIIPFYSFTRKNIELQLRTLGEHPERINQILAFFQNIGDKPSAEEKKSLPDYIRSSIGIKLEDLPNGIKQYISSFGTPVEQFANLVNSNPILNTISQMNPILKVPTEIGIGKDSFRKKDLQDVYDASEYKGMPKVLKDMLEIREVKKDVLEKMPNGKLKKTGERTVYVADPVKLLIARSLFTSRGVTYLDQLFGGDLHGFAKLLKTTTGIKPQQIDLELQQSIKERDQKRKLEDLLKRNGEIATFSRSFIPKN